MKKIIYPFLLITIIISQLACNSTGTDSEVTDDNADIPVDEIEDTIVTNSNINWENWYLSVPINSGSGKATSIGYEDIINDRLTAEESKYFYENEDGSYTMWTQFTGYTTSGLSELGDKYCRTELREYWKGNQDTDDNWSMTTGVHILETTLQVDFVEGNGRTIVAQIHGKASDGITGDPATVKIRWNSGTIQIDHYTKPDNDEAWTSNYDEKLDFGQVDNEIFTFKIKIENGKLFCALSCEEKGIDIDYTEIYDYVGNGYVHENYFKTGNYYGWNDDYEKAAQVVLYKVKTEHSL
ncbi:polysaccharide lyase family 7 protein [Formosa algae]|uniref:Alginate lyase 2 domain-containing protein n=1 Tax=Formosa algae TaxID=225843 RepID=A0ABU0CKG7_9FLAO|nr:polysaccharide lyase family 7 protein [Formosa algae]MDQ0336573.1 hypothetical protein [Formosa algae]